jgi:4-amino-4-deoxy-L-arabinose transferase-like glycosyltransferase
MLIFVFSLGMAVIHLSGAPETNQAYITVQGSPWSDALVYDRAALDLKNGLGLGEAFLPTLAAPRAPGYITLIAAVYHYVGHRPIVVCLLQIGMVALICVMVNVIGAATFSRWVGATAAVAVAIGQPMYGWANLVMTEIPFVFALALAIVAVLTCERKLLQCAVAGVWIAVCATFRPIGLFPLVIMAVYLTLKYWRDGWRKAFVAPIAFVLGASVVVAPLAVRNWQVVGTPSLTASIHAGWLWGHHVEGWLWGYPGGKFDTERLWEPLWAKLVYATPDERQRLQQIKQEVSQSVKSTLPATLRKVLRTPFVYYASPPKAYREPTSLDFLFLLLAAAVVVGIVARPNLNVALLLGVVIVIMFGNYTVVSLETTRYRFTTDWLVLLLAFGGIAHWMRTISKEGQAQPSDAQPQIPSSFAQMPTVLLVMFAAFMAFPLTKMALAHVRTAGNPPTRAVSEDDLLRAFGPDTGKMAVREQAHALTFEEYRRQALERHGDLSSIEGRLVAWRGVIEPIAALKADEESWRDKEFIFVKRPYRRTMATFRADGARQRDIGRVWLEIPEHVARFERMNAVQPALVLARIETNTKSPITGRYRLIAVAVSR